MDKCRVGVVWPGERQVRCAVEGGLPMSRRTEDVCRFLARWRRRRRDGDEMTYPDLMFVEEVDGKWESQDRDCFLCHCR